MDKLAVIQAYGGKCACPPCGETRLEFLTYEHVGGWGKTHRGKERRRVDMERFIVDRGLPSNITVMCISCNWSMGVWGYCPHMRELDPTWVRHRTGWANLSTGESHSFFQGIRTKKTAGPAPPPPVGIISEGRLDWYGGGACACGCGEEPTRPSRWKSGHRPIII
jgi:hypothetical protein